ncbi:protein kinase [Kitasatospora sp. NPDC053057]|uniref:protein kinase domain-containing protein n=1 Tax=Kitasatospora sp. NPDC053057 TaxID=3364062 RepID=UPI0037C7AE90
MVADIIIAVLISWLARLRHLGGQGLLDPARVSELDALGMIWSSHAGCRWPPAFFAGGRRRLAYASDEVSVGPGPLVRREAGSTLGWTAAGKLTPTLECIVALVSGATAAGCLTGDGIAPPGRPGRCRKLAFYGGSVFDGTGTFGLRPAAAAGDSDLHATGGGGDPFGTGAAPPDRAARAEEAVGRLVGGRYRLLERLGAGGMGTVWRARDEVVDRDVALKEPRVPEHVGAAEQRTAFARMEREARAAARIDHPSVVTIHDVVTEDGRPWIVMELVRGRSLAEVLEEGTLAPREAARIALAVLGALGAAHECGVLHRDVKPGNVMLGRHERVVLADFGIAQVEGEQKLTETGGFIGSPEYLAPERVLGRRAGPASDLWSLGVTLYQAVEGVSPFRRQTTPATLQAVLLAELPPLRQAGPLAPVIAAMLRREEEQRSTVQDARAQLQSLAAPAPTAHPATVLGAAAAAPAPGSAPWRRHPRRWAAAAAGTLAAVTALVLVLCPFDDGLAAGWRSYDEYRMRLSVAAPADWTIETTDNTGDQNGAYRGTRYTAPKGDVWLAVDRKEKETQTPRAIVEQWKHDDDVRTPPLGGAPTVATVESATEQGRDAAILTETYSKDGDGTPRRLSKMLVLVSSHQERLTLRVDVPDGRDAAATASGLLAKARAGYRVRDL